MADDTPSVMHRALEDLNEGLRALLGNARTSPGFLDALLDNRSADPQPRGAARTSGFGSRRGTRPRVAATRRPRRPMKSHLVLLK